MPLFIVPTPIGNMSDITFRAVETLKNSHFILAEDTRHSAQLLKKYDIKAQMISYRDQIHETLIDKVLEKMKMNLYLSLISDAGTPTLSDPGYKLVRDVIKAGYKVIPLPGAFAGSTALCASGLPTDRFVFLGFPPKNEKSRQDLLKQYVNDTGSIIFYESPLRVVSLLKSCQKAYGDRYASISNDLTKMYEYIKTDRLSKLIDTLEKESELRGEFVVIIAKADFSI